MRQVTKHRSNGEQGFSLMEILVALLITLAVMASVYGLLQKGQDNFRREPQVADMNQSARAGLQRISEDLSLAGFKTPPAMAVLWDDGGGINPDELTIVYAEESVPTSQPMPCDGTGGGGGNDAGGGNKGGGGGGGDNGGGGGGGGGPCNTIEQSSTLNIDLSTFDPPLWDPESALDNDAEGRMEGAYSDEMVLFVIETEDCNGDGQVGAIPFEITQPPRINKAGGDPNLQLNHNPGQGNAELNPPGGFNGEVHPDCATVGLFHVIQYRINPPPPTDNPVLERRDLSVGTDWIPLSNNIESLQVQYAVGNSDIFVDEPAVPVPDDPTTWVTRVRVTVFGRSDSTDMQGATAGVFAAEDTHLRNAFSTTVSLRNQVYNAAAETDNAQYN